MGRKARKSRIEVLTFRHFSTTSEWIASKAWLALTYRIVIHYAALGVHPARANARIATFLFDACKIGRTLGANDTLGAAVWCAAHIVGQARACGRLANHTAL